MHIYIYVWILFWLLKSCIKTLEEVSTTETYSIHWRNNIFCGWRQQECQFPGCCLISRTFGIFNNLLQNFSWIKSTIFPPTNPPYLHPTEQSLLTIITYVFYIGFNLHIWRSNWAHIGPKHWANKVWCLRHTTGILFLLLLYIQNICTCAH
jgi:hypothetical protein